MRRGRYPTDDELDEIRQWDHDDLDGLIEFVRDEVWEWPEWGVESTASGRWRLATGGWSGNEEVISAMAENTVWWSLHWRSSRRGGLYIFSGELKHMRDAGGREVPTLAHQIRSSRVRDYVEAFQDSDDGAIRSHAVELQAEMDLWASKAEEIEEWIEREISQSNRLYGIGQDLVEMNDTLTEALLNLDTALSTARKDHAPCDLCYEEGCTGDPTGHCPCNQRCHNREEDAQAELDSALAKAREVLSDDQPRKPIKPTV